MSWSCACGARWGRGCAPPAPASRRARCAATAIAGRLRAAGQRALASAASRVELAARALQAVSPLATLERGFAIVARPGGAPLIRHAAELRAGEDIEARLADGIVTARVTGRRQA